MIAADDVRATVPLGLAMIPTGEGDPVDHIFWGVVSIGILAVLVSLLLMMLIRDFAAASSSGRRRPKLKG